MTRVALEEREGETEIERRGGSKRERVCRGSDSVSSIRLCLSSSGGRGGERDVRNMQWEAVIIICAPHRRGSPCALRREDPPRCAEARSDASRTAGPTGTQTLMKGQKMSASQTLIVG